MPYNDVFITLVLATATLCRGASPQAKRVVPARDRHLPLLPNGNNCVRWSCTVETCLASPTYDVNAAVRNEAICLYWPEIGADCGDVVTATSSNSSDVACTDPDQVQIVGVFKIWRAVQSFPTGSNHYFNFANGKPRTHGRCVVEQENIDCLKGTSNTICTHDIHCPNDDLILIPP